MPFLFSSAAGITKPIVSAAIIANLCDQSVVPGDNEGNMAGLESSLAPACPVLILLFLQDYSN